ncbi:MULTISPECIES: polyprenyl synthetase family protein [unclassified Arthrobacter]|uniref:polyprenyl synthetase family protein n=1 Tax=unclassified Arthrobacter TaxID=235627 RepID=UPI001D14F0FE|nr:MULTISPECIES: polyprenyl synthetase family protein [unclassified Arthrobacter]MCC3290181.1 polyprenyl synthetase family protein [Arthrobacter sp. zg-Y1110]MCC3300308.1 polyprenyl synthetase family protein [Arthrobacter sp. zg-Y895]UWX84432.1 polyprenyl synthetase family protein [Arthrobacter sp. zg-Y1110]
MQTHPPLDLSIGQDLVETVLNRFFERAKARAAKLGPGYLSLWQALENSTAGGKRVRPRILLTAYLNLGGTDTAAAASVGAAFELLHTALIVHDDVIDLDFTRRGHENVSGVYRELAAAAGVETAAARHRGLSAGVIAGDLALTGAFRMLDSAEVDTGLRSRMAEILDEAVFASAGGELIDVDLSFHPDAPPIAEILHMERLKTAVYSFEAPLQAGAVLAGAPDDVVTTLGLYGRDIGIAYQVVDDLLGVFGTESATGKSSFSDLREGKRTVLVSYVAQKPEWEELSGLIGNPELTARDAARARELLVSSGARDHAQQLVREYADRARQHLDCPAVTPGLRAALSTVVDDAVNRGR